MNVTLMIRNKEARSSAVSKIGKRVKRVGLPWVLILFGAIMIGIAASAVVACMR